MKAIGEDPLTEVVLITEAYSASNIGDRELVDRSISYARRAYPDAQLYCLAVDTDSFSGKVEVPLRERLFPRLSYMRSGPLGRGITALGWGVRICVLSALTALPRPAQRRIAAHLCAARLVPPTVGLYAEADHVVAVGGGYLGDQYTKETLLTLWTWWWAGRMGATVETMPLSYEVRSFHLARATRALANSVRWRVRDSSSVEALRAAGVRGELVPDLAFANYRGRGDAVRFGTLVALVGSDYLSEAEQRQLTSTLAESLASPKHSDPVVALSMHSAMASTHVGGDSRASDLLVAALETLGVMAIEAGASSYSEVVDACARADIVISARMHAGIAALCAGSRVGLLAYEEKHFALMRDLGLGDYVVDIRADPSEIAGMVMRLHRADSSLFDSAAMKYYERLAEHQLVSSTV